MTHKEKILRYYTGEKERLIRVYLEALEVLLERYVVANCRGRCPLCEATTGDDCRDCPWYVLLGDSCPFSMSQFYRYDRVKQRVAQIKHWIQSFKEALKEVKA